jgi:glyoxylase I family protein
LAFAVTDLEVMLQIAEQYNVKAELIRVDEFTNKRFTFITLPDSLPIEFYEL